MKKLEVKIHGQTNSYIIPYEHEYDYSNHLKHDIRIKQWEKIMRHEYKFKVVN